MKERIKLFDKILVANRGEIAIRVMRAARELCISTVAVYAEVDKDSWHVSFADEAYCLGERELSDTYLNVDQIIQIAVETGSDAIHPGYGFLSESPALIEACEKAGIVFIGPDTRSIKLMGNKIESRKFVQDIGVPTTQGVTGDVDTLIRNASKIPLPILVKAASGGGGKGMRIVHDLADLPGIIETTSREAKSYFGDGTVYVEKFVVEPRHIEIQVMGDKHGNVVHLFERECSIQRRYQKIIEESPSPTLNDEIRHNMGNAAVRIAKEIGYGNAGTIEFLVDKDLNYYFLEMNTRIQVEHPTTEMVTGIDLVQEQIRVAAGNPLSFKQEDVRQNGHAIECRVYAEDPANNFLPSPGTMILYREPESQRVRIDACTDKAGTIHSFYDPMISKVIVWEDTREHARLKMIGVLKDYIIHGIKSNIRFLIELLQEKNFVDNTISTKFCDDHLEELVSASKQKRGRIVLDGPLASYILYFLKHNSKKGDSNIWQKIGYWRDILEFKLTMDDEPFEIVVYPEKSGLSDVIIGESRYLVEIPHLSENKITVKAKEGIFNAFISHDNYGNAYVSCNGHIFNIHRDDLLIKEDFYTGIDSPNGGEGNLIFTPMPGKVVKVNTTEGQEVQKDDILLVVEAMKMENNILALRHGIIEKVNVKPGDMVDGSKPLIVLREELES
nr:biotin/lipoyl-binding protein [Bacteroidota bacterium]